MILIRSWIRKNSPSYSADILLDLRFSKAYHPPGSPIRRPVRSTTCWQSATWWSASKKILPGSEPSRIFPIRRKKPTKISYVYAQIGVRGVRNCGVLACRQPRNGGKNTTFPWRGEARRSDAASHWAERPPHCQVCEYVV